MRHIPIMTNTDEAIELRKRTREAGQKGSPTPDPIPVLSEKEPSDGAED